MLATPVLVRTTDWDRVPDGDNALLEICLVLLPSIDRFLLIGVFSVTFKTKLTDAALLLLS